MNSEEIMVSNDFNGEAWHILDQLLAHKKTLYMDPVDQTVDIDECKKFIEFAKILWQSKISISIYQNEISTINLYVGYKEIELADLIINLENIILAIQLKERNEFVI